MIVQNGKNGEWFGKMALHKGVQDVPNGDEQWKMENTNHYAQRYSKVSEWGVQNGCLGGLCSVITGTGKRLRRSATLQGEENTPCRTGVQNEAGWCPEWKEREW